LTGAENNNAAKMILNALSSNSSIVDLDFSDNELNDDTARALALALSKNKTLAHVDLSDNDIGDDGIAAIMSAQSTHKTLEYLDISENNFEDEAIQVIASYLRTQATGLKCLKLNDIGNQIHEINFNPIAMALESNNTLEELDVSDNHLSFEFGVILATSLLKNKQLQKLDCSDNNLGDDGAVALAKAITHNNRLNNLNFRSNGISDKGFIALSNALKNNSSLTKLSIYDDKITDAGYQAFAEMLKTNTTLIDFQIDSNNIQKETKKEIKEYLKRNKELKNKITNFINGLSEWKQNPQENARSIQIVITEISENPIFENGKPLDELQAFKQLCLAQHYFDQYQISALPADKAKNLKMSIICLKDAIQLGYHTEILDALANEIVDGINQRQQIPHLNQVMDELQLAQDHSLRLLAKQIQSGELVNSNSNHRNTRKTNVK
jgi:Ran GTPase-activating protein (RanGAP) involved in mRNA processing and transport